MDADGEEASPKPKKAAKKGRLKRDSQPGEAKPLTHGLNRTSQSLVPLHLVLMVPVWQQNLP